MIWLDRLNGRESERTPGESEGQGSLHAAIHVLTKSQTRLSD